MFQHKQERLFVDFPKLLPSLCGSILKVARKYLGTSSEMLQAAVFDKFFNILLLVLDQRFCP
jgi:hypothetical protein